MGVMWAVVDKVVVFRLGHESYGVDIRHVREVVAWAEPTPLPGAPAQVEGVLNLRDEVVPVLDLARRLGATRARPDAGAQIMVVESGGGVAGLVVDEVMEVLSLGADQVQPVAALARGAGDPLVAGIVRLEGRLIIVVDLVRIAGEAIAS